MANRLEMANVQAILQLHALQWSQRRIARHLGLDRGAVAKALRQAQPDPEPAKAPSGSEGPKPATWESAPGPTLRALSEPAPTASAASADPNPEPAKAPSGPDAGIPTGTVATAPALNQAPGDPGVSSSAATTRSRSVCERFRALILGKLEDDLSAQRIYQDLVADHGYAGSYYSVRRFVRKLAGNLPFPFRRMECAAGFEAQVDYGTGAPIVGSDGKRRKAHVFRVVLSHSRKGYCEASFRQTTDDFIRALENAFWSFGGVPQTVVIDNLKAAVKHADWYDPELQPKVRSFCQHYGTAILPTRPRTPRHKGKIERGIGYVKDNALKGRAFTALEEQNGHLAHWEQTIADTRIHGTTRQQVRQVFEEVERRALRPLPIERFVSFHEVQRIVSRDGHVEVAKAFYSVPPEYLTRTVWVRWDARLVRILNQKLEQIALHVRHDPGRFSTAAGHIAAEKIGGVERGVTWLMSRVRLIGSETAAWAEAMLCARGIEGTRVLMGLIALTQKHSGAALESACKTALSHGEFRLRAIRALIARQTPLVQGALPFLEAHPLIRPLDDYAHIVAAALARKDAPQNRAPHGGSNNDREVRL
jgi:transposase